MGAVLLPIDQWMKGIRGPLFIVYLNGERALSTVNPKLWNTLPLHIQKAPTVECQQSHLKTHSVAVNCVVHCVIYVFNYLLF